MALKHKTIGYLRVSTDRQDVASQRHSILEYAHRNDFRVDRFFSYKISSRRTTTERGIDDLVAELGTGDQIVVAELSRLGRSLGQIIRILDDLRAKGIGLIAIKEDLKLLQKQDKQSKIMVAIFGLLAELERDLISERTREGLQVARSKGMQIGRPKGRLGKSRLDGKEAQIQLMLDKRVSKASISKILDVSVCALNNFIKTRGLKLRV